MQHARVSNRTSSSQYNARKDKDSSIGHRQMSANHASLTVGVNKVFSNRQIDNSTADGSKTANRRVNHGIKPLGTPLFKVPSDTHTKDTQYPPIQVNLWFHEFRTTQEEILIDPKAFPEGIVPGQVIEIQSLGPKSSAGKKLVLKLGPKNIREQTDLSDITSLTKTQSQTQSQFQISLMSNPFQKLLDLAPRSLIQVKKVTNLDSVAIDSMEIFIKDVNLSRDAMWQFSSSLVDKCCYTDQRLSYLGYRIGVVKYIYKSGRKVFSGYINEDTKIIYRSESAKLTVLIQLSREMWHFEENGEIMFHKLVNNLFPKIFRRWRDKGTHHSITIVLFTSVDLTDIPWTHLSAGERPPKRRDYFRVVVDQVNILHWDRIMANLRLEFANFKRDIMLRKGDDSNYIMEGQPLPAVKGNTLEALNVGLVLLNDRFRNTDLKHSLNHFMLITAGIGLFDVDYKTFLETSKKITSIDTSLDIICLSEPPLHVTPLFRFIKSGKLCHCVPVWCDISFYKNRQEENFQWIPRCKIYELQMMGVMENEINDAKIPRYHIDSQMHSLQKIMERYDEHIFKPIQHNQESKKEVEVEAKLEEPKFKAPKVKDSKATLSLIFNERTSLLPIYNSTTNSSAIGMVAHPSSEVSALTTLYNINKNREDKTQMFTSSFSTPSSSEQPSNLKASVSASSKLPRIIQNFRKDSSSSSSAAAAAAVTNTTNTTTTPTTPKIINGEKLFSRRDNIRRAYIAEAQTKTNNEKRASVSETQAEAPYAAYWIEIKNPSRDVGSDIMHKAPLSKWSNLFPDNIQRKIIKWRSFQAPAALPIVSRAFPTLQQIQENYTSQTYSIYLSPENYLELTTTSELMREMIQLRLMLGFQICYGEKVKKVEAERKHTGNADSVIKYFPSGDCNGSRIYMSLDDEIHRIHCDYGGNLNVQLYRKTKLEEESKITLGQRKPQSYFPLIRTRYADEYGPSQVDTLASHPQTYNWNQFDQLLAGLDDAMPDNKKEFHKMKFVVMPAEIPKNAYSLTNEHLNAEEIRVEGLRKLIAYIEKGKYVRNQSYSKASERYFDIIFYTGNLYDFLTNEAQNYDITGNQSILMIPENARFNKNVKLSELAMELQHQKSGLNLVDRTWHFKRHLQCFIGSEFVTWIMDCFEDIHTREEATAFGQSLMDKGLFKHVESRHGFIDGYYFYEFEPQYLEKIDKTNRGSSWFSSNVKKDGSLTPKSNSSPKVQSVGELVKITSSQNLSFDASSLADSTGRKRMKFILGRSVKFDVDPLRKSYRPELVTVHYDRVHNPEHCYHIRLQWLNTTNKFVEDTITTWSRMCEKYGLKLVETPWKELCEIPKVNPFHSFVEVKLLLNPWLEEEFADDKILSTNKYYYHLYFLKKLEFFLDNRTSSFFQKDNIDITYSWGKPTFQYAQFIHKTGFYIVELRDNGDFFLAPNNMHLTRIGLSSTPAGEYETTARAIHLDSQKIMLYFRAACQNQEFLKKVFHEAKYTWSEETITQIN
ncbi:hypothetical protein KGF56_003275 [Candida oxycetoniae]|uniref:Vacuolar membrane-associated protein IML1 n=1 Tax=Candida oxycetoniae TaxID=497107 RepID=A0AAI9SW65_9ASCO|nr:uncharacterized protein KGF56_003275 [Candida oxycetoniae]KAI3403845.2 hypothetical protein KGF56_003275 [Candida oxycetoniae]